MRCTHNPANQFWRPRKSSRGPVPQQILLLGLLYVVLATITDGAYAILAGRLRHWFGGQAFHGRVQRYASGSIYIGLGVSTALVDRN